MSATFSASDSIAARLREVRSRITAAAIRAGRDPAEITLVAVTKTHPAEMIQQAIAAGARDFGENKVQEAEDKIPRLGRDAARWHLIGHLQSNKARKAMALFDLIHSVDSVSLIQRLERICSEENREELSVLIQVDLAQEKTKSGVSPKDLGEVVTALDQSSRLKLEGLMILPPFCEDPDDVRPYFRRLRELRDKLRDRGVFGEERGELSMGMTHDFEVAIEEGATIVRVGTAIFGQRRP
jgi:PLP dependent protein